MKVIFVNGGPHKEGCTYTALREVADALEQNGIETEIFWLGNDPVAGCIDCGYCKKTDRCFRNDCVNKFLEKAADADGFVFGTPVHFASAAGALISFLDRAFYGRDFSGKVGAAVISCRRAGSTATFDEINQVFCHQRHAHRHIQLLEHGSRQYPRRSQTGSGRHADHADSGQKHGLAFEMHRSWQTGWCSRT